MERDDGETAVLAQQLLRRFQAALELAELVVDRDAQRLEGARRGIDAVLGAAVPMARRTISARCTVRVMGARSRARTMARAMRREWRSSP